MNDDDKRKMGDMLVSATMYSCIALTAMQRLFPDQSSEAEIDDLHRQFIRRMKDLNIEGMSYDKQAQLVTRALEAGDEFFRDYRAKAAAKKSRKTPGK